MQKTADPTHAAEHAHQLPAALRPQPDEDGRVQRANRLVARLADHARSPLLEPRFLEGARGLALALAGVAAMRANDFSTAVADEIAARLTLVLDGAEAQTEAVVPALVQARSVRRGGVRRARSSETVGSRQ